MLFTKAGEAGWKSIIPIYSFVVLLKIVGRDWWRVILVLIPIVGPIVWIILTLDLPRASAVARASESDWRSCP